MKKKINLSAVLGIILSVLILTGLITNVIVVNNPVPRYDLSDYVVSGDDSYDAIIVLGCGVWPDGSPTPLLSDRLDVAISLYFQGAAPKLLMSGDHMDDSYNEVACMWEYAVARGVPEEDIFLDHLGLSTGETFYRAKNMFGISSAIVVTQEYHLSRALFIARDYGLDVVGVRAQGHVFYTQLYYSFRELFARTKDCLVCAFSGEKTYTGDTVDITGDGRVTL